ncbi:MAG: hypothetical protein AB7P24_02280 [Nitrospira sp.]
MATSGLARNKFIGHESHTKSIPCSRCQGLMVVEQGFDSLTGAGPALVSIRRCVQCGEVIDPVILQNRRLQLGNELS